MIKFFRKIRQQLINQNRVRKYLLYAIGEIILVVIGILIALQINTWNQDRINKKESTVILESIYEDLVKDTLMLTQRIDAYQKLLTHNIKLTEELHSDSANLNTFRTVAEEFDPTFWIITNFNNTTLNSIESTGKLDLLDDNLKKELLEYKYNQAESLNDRNTHIYTSLMNNFTSKYIFGKGHGKFILELNSKIKDQQEYVNLLSHLVGYKNFMINSSLTNWTRTKEKAKKILKAIEQRRKL